MLPSFNVRDSSETRGLHLCPHCSQLNSRTRCNVFVIPMLPSNLPL